MNDSDPRNRFFEAAQEILANQGYGALKQAAVCEQVGVTTGSFYHAFENWAAFTAAFLENWRRERTTLIAELARTTGDPVGQLEALLAGTLGLNHRSECAIRVWAAVDPDVARVQARVDQDRYDVVLEAMVQLVGKREARRYANWGLNILLGFEAATNGQDIADLEWELRQVLEAAASKSAAASRARTGSRRSGSTKV